MFFNRIFLICTEACDSRCSLCDYWLIKTPRMLSPAFAEEKIAPFIREGGISVACISGGEPTTHPDLGRIVAAVRDAGASATLITSTTMLGERFPDIRHRITHYMISLDGADRETYRRCRGIDAFDHAVGWINRLRVETVAEVAISCVMQAANSRNLRALYALALSTGTQRLFLRAPDLKPNAFGRERGARARTIRQSLLDEEQLAQLADDIEWLIETDQQHGILGQKPETLRRKVSFLRCLSLDEPYEEPDMLCDVPLTSLVIQPDGTCNPCFYLPHSQPFDLEPTAGPAFTEVYRRMLEDAAFRRQWCNACQQFDGHKRKTAQPMPV
ncbi:MAG TPA: radical SAM protein [Allosphingosinicella sp.]